MRTIGVVHLPPPLTTDDPTASAELLTAYYAPHNPGLRYTGALFDEWDSTGTRAADTNTFTADDFVAITLLSVSAGGPAARALLCDRADEFNGLLAAIGDDRDLADEPDPIDSAWPAWQLETRLRSVRGIGLTIATKLIARKRPRLYPIWDEVVTEVLGTRQRHLQPIHAALSSDTRLRSRLQAARTTAGLPTVISELRVLDVITWMYGTTRSAR